MKGEGCRWCTGGGRKGEGAEMRGGRRDVVCKGVLLLFWRKNLFNSLLRWPFCLGHF